MFEYQSSHYEPKTDDLFLVYTAINGEFNANGWRVEDIDKNIKTGLGRPGVIKPKDSNNPDDTNQEGQFVHPVFRNASLQALLQNQESFSIARAVRLDKPSASDNWRVWLQVTDPNAKIALRSASTVTGYPKYISPQVITFPNDFPDEENNKTYKHWLISHWAFVDIPAYGEQMKVRGNCYGDIDGCKIKLQNASTAGFCVKQALNNLSSHNANSQTQNIMSESTNATTSQTSSQPVQANNQTGQITYTWPNPTISPTGTTANLTIPINNPTQQAPGHSKQETEPNSDQKPGMAKGDASGSEAREPNKEEEKGAESLAELKKAYSDLQKRFALLEEDNVVRKQNEKKLYASSKVARYSNHFKSKESFEKEVDTIVRYSQVMSEDELESYLADKYALIEAPIIKAKSASVQSTMHEVPEVKANNASSISSDNNRKFIELVDMFSNGGTS